jgi:DNA-binding winged helix-turn-helix (wHTH) protein/TolB-like protein
MAVHTRMQGGDQARFRFGAFEVDAGNRVLRKQGIKMRLQEQPFEVLLALLEASGELVTREQLRQRLWPEGTFVEFDHALNTAVKKIRAALCDDACVPRYVETIPRRGYRFLAVIDKRDATVDGNWQQNNGLLAPGLLRRKTSHEAALIFSVFAIAAAGFVLWSLLRFHAGPPVTVVVLPFHHLSSRQQALASELRRAVSEGLGRLQIANVLVVTRDLKPESRADSKLAAKSIDYVLDGSVSEDADRLHVAVELIRIDDQSGVWAEDFDQELRGPAADRQLADNIVRHLQPTLSLLGRGSR